jgi:hypothetical protein
MRWSIDRRTYRGVPGFVEAIADLDTAWQQWRQEVDDVLDAGDKAVAVNAVAVSTA